MLWERPSCPIVDAAEDLLSSEVLTARVAIEKALFLGHDLHVFVHEAKAKPVQVTPHISLVPLAVLAHKLDRF